MMKAPPEIIRDEAELDAVLTQPSPTLRDFISQVNSPLVILGAGGKMGPTLAVLAKHAADLVGHPLEVIAISRYSSATRHWLEDNGVQTYLQIKPPLGELPNSESVIYLVGQFAPRTPACGQLTRWCQYAAERYRDANFALSTGCVYPLVPVDGGGATGVTPVPLGEWRLSCARTTLRIPVQPSRHGGLIRLNYAIDLRYGVLHDIALKIRRAAPSIWPWGISTASGKATPMTYPARAIPLYKSSTGPEHYRAENLVRTRRCYPGAIDGLRTNSPAEPTAWLNNPARSIELFDEPATSLETLLRWTALDAARRSQPLQADPFRCATKY